MLCVKNFKEKGLTIYLVYWIVIFLVHHLGISIILKINAVLFDTYLHLEYKIKGKIRSSWVRIVERYEKHYFSWCPKKLTLKNISKIDFLKKPSSEFKLIAIFYLVSLSLQFEKTVYMVINEKKSKIKFFFNLTTSFSKSMFSKIKRENWW